LRSRAIPLLCACAALLAGCGRQATDTLAPHKTGTKPPPAVTLTVFAAASLTEAFTELGQQFETQHPGVRLVFNFAASQQLAQQLDQGAPADIFASANDRQMDVAVRSRRVRDGSQETFARNRLVVIVPKDNPAGVSSLKDLAGPGLKLVLAAREVPVGQYALDLLDRAVQDPAFGAGYREAVLANVASYEENVKSVLTKVTLGEGDAGIVYVSDISRDGADKIGRIDIPEALNKVATYPIAPVSDGAQPDLAQAFIDLVLSSTGQQILARHNLIPVK